MSIDEKFVPEFIKQQRGVGEFKFHEKWKNPKTNRFIKHVYTLDDVPLKGITKVLEVIAKPALYQWYANMVAKSFGWIDKKYNTAEAVDAALDKAYRHIVDMSPEQYKEFVDSARTAANDNKETAADVGTVAHKMVEMYVINQLNNTNSPVTIAEAIRQLKDDDNKKVEVTPEEEKMITTMYNNFFTWATENSVEFIESEKKMYSRAMWVAGTCDLVFRMNGKKYVGDVKTYSGIYDRTPFFQCAGYRLMLEEMGEKDFDGSMIIRLGKDGSFETRSSFDFETDKQGFLACLTLTKMLETYTK